MTTHLEEFLYVRLFLCGGVTIFRVHSPLVWGFIAIGFRRFEIDWEPFPKKSLDLAHLMWLQKAHPWLEPWITPVVEEEIPF